MKRCLTIAVMLCLCGGLARAQNQISENPEGAVKLRRIWSLKGWGRVDSVVGNFAGGMSDIDNDGFDDFYVRVGLEAWFYRGGDPPSSVPSLKIDSVDFAYDRQLPVGDFLGSGDTMIGLINARVHEFSGARFVRLLFYRAGTDSLLESTSYLLDLNEQPNNLSLHAGDLDRDGDDELIVVNEQSGSTRVRIYRGGAEFSLDEPTMTITAESSFYSSVVDFDADGHFDLCLAYRAGNTSRLRFWWGSETSPWNWTDTPDRIIHTSLTRIGLGSVPNLLVDYNGDRQMDFAHNTGTDFYLWLSDPTIDIRSRSFDSTDFDLHVPRASGGSGYGYIADSLLRYMMLPILPPRDEPDDSAKGLGGGADGPNMTFDAWFPGNEGPLFGGWDAGDIDGNGWQDRIIHSGEYGGPGVGIALIIGGGPYIPSDDPTVDVREIATGEHVAAIHLWPNPVDDELHIAWRGDLTRRPARMLVHDLSGRSIADISLHYWTGEALWNRGAAPAGTYIITILDTDAEILTTTTILVR